MPVKPSVHTLTIAGRSPARDPEVCFLHKAGVQPPEAGAAAPAAGDRPGAEVRGRLSGADLRPAVRPHRPARRGAVGERERPHPAAAGAAVVTVPRV
jgi:hypothetical protein